MWASTLFPHNTVAAMVFLTVGVSGLMATLAMFWGCRAASGRHRRGRRHRPDQ